MKGESRRSSWPRLALKTILAVAVAAAALIVTLGSDTGLVRE